MTYSTNPRSVRRNICVGLACLMGFSLVVLVSIGDQNRMRLSHTFVAFNAVGAYNNEPIPNVEVRSATSDVLQTITTNTPIVIGTRYFENVLKNISNTHKRGPYSFREKFLLWDLFNYPKFGKDVVDDTLVNDQKYFIYRCDTERMSICGGWADRLKGAIASYLIANLTGRVFKAEYLNPACDMSKYLIPNRVNWSWPIPSKFPDDNNAYQIVQHIDDHKFKNDIGTTNFTTKFNVNKTFIYFKANLENLSSLKTSKLYKNELSWMSNLTSADAYAAAYKHLFKLSAKLQTILQSILFANLPSPQHKLVCVHARMGRNPSIDDDSEIRNSLENLPKVWSFVANQSTSDLHKVFIMSDSAEVLQSAKEQPFKDRLVTIPGTIVHVDRHGGKTTEYMCDGFEKLLLEHHMLMNCDVLVRGHSGLSVIASAVRGTDKDLYCLKRTGDISPCLRNDFSTFL